MRRPFPLVQSLVQAAAKAWPAALALLAAALVLVVTTPRAAGVEKYPEPSVYPIAWEVHFDHKVPKRIIVDVTGSAHPVAYWYLTYTVTNATDKPLPFQPRFELMADDGRVVRSDLAIPPQVFDAIKRREGNKLLEPARKAEGTLNPGVDQAKDSVAIWPEPLQRMGMFSIFVGGLSGEFVEMKDKDGNPLTSKNEKTGEAEPVILHKTLHLTYHIFGDEVHPGADEAHPRVEKWVMR